MSRSCDHFRGQVDSWLDAELGNDDRAELVLHLASCEACRSFFQQADTIASRLTTLGRAADAIADAPARTMRRRSPFSHPATRIAAAIALLVVAGLMWRVGLWRSERTASPTQIVRIETSHQPPRLQPSTTDVRQIVVASEAPTLAVQMESGNPRIQIVMFYEPMRADTSPPQTVSPGL